MKFIQIRDFIENVKDEKKNIDAFILTDIELSEELMDEGRCCIVGHRGLVWFIFVASRIRESAVVRSTLYITVRQYAARKRTANL